jgi:aldose 1-epimerase
MSFSISENIFGRFPVVEIIDNSTGSNIQVAYHGATLLRYNIPLNGSLFNIIDGFADEEEFIAARGARSWIMIPFANRIPEGWYTFLGNKYQLKPVPPRTQVIHGFASYHNYKLMSTEVNETSAKVIFEMKDIRPGVYEGYPFALNVYVAFQLSSSGLNIEVTAENDGSYALPFGTGWHPYFRTNNNGIENLIFTVNAGQIIKLDSNFIPLEGNNAYSDIKQFPELDFNAYIPAKDRKINNRILDHCYAELEINSYGLSECSLTDPENGLKITMFQKGGVTLAFSGDSLTQRKRKSVALEPMQFITNAFNREELADDIIVNPGEKKQFHFGCRGIQE